VRLRRLVILHVLDSGQLGSSMLYIPYFTGKRIITGKWIKSGDYVVLMISLPISNQMDSSFWKVL